MMRRHGSEVARRSRQLGRLINVFVDICLLRAGPQALPASRFLLGLTLLLGLVTGTVVLVEGAGGPLPALLLQLIDLALVLGLLYLATSLSGLQARFLQTATALLGSGVLINLISMPLQLLMGDDPSTSLFGELAVLLYLLLIPWALLVVAHVLRHAFELRLSAAMLISLGYFMVVNWLVQGLFPAG